MAAESSEDRLVFLNTAEFGIEVTLFPNTQNETVIQGIFDAEHFEIDNGLSVISSAEPQLHVRTEDVTSVTQDSALTANGVSYTVADVQPDGTGMTILRLHQA